MDPYEYRHRYRGPEIYGFVDSWVSKRERILAIGIDVAEILQYFGTHGHRAVGVDIEEAHWKYAIEHGLDHALTYLRAEGSDQNYGLIIFTDWRNGVSDSWQLVRKALSMLHPRGVLYFDQFDGDLMKHLNGEGFEVLNSEPGGPIVFRRYGRIRSFFRGL